MTEPTQARLRSAIGELGCRRNEAARALLRTWTASQDRSALLCATNHVAPCPGDAMLVPYDAGESTLGGDIEALRCLPPSLDTPIDD